MKIQTSVTQWLHSAGMGRNGIPLPVSGVPPPKVVAPPPGKCLLQNGFVLMVHTVFFGQLIFGKIITIVATRGQILRLKCTKFYFGLGAEPQTPLWELTMLPQTLIAAFKGTYF